MLIDCFMFFNEYDIVEGRLEYLYDRVDHFIVVEADHTHNGQPKPLNWLSAMPRYKRWLDKVIYLPMAVDVSGMDFTTPHATEDQSKPQWMMDRIQRSHIAHGLRFFPGDSVVMISDADEIPALAAIDAAVGNLGEIEAIAMQQQFFWYDLSLRQVNHWPGTILTTVGTALRTGVQALRDVRYHLPSMTHGGWHLSYWGGAEQIQTKVASFTHQEFNKPQYTSAANLAARKAQAQDLYGRMDNPLEAVDPRTLDPDLVRIWARYCTNIPHYADRISGWFTDGDFGFYREMVATAPATGHFVEVGSWKGRSSAFMAVEIANSGKNIRFDCVDTWQGSVEHKLGGEFEDSDCVNGQLRQRFDQNMRPVDGRYRAVEMTSLAASQLYDEQSLDLVFLDAAHDLENVRADITAWLPKIKKGGVIAGHDWHHPPIQQAVHETLGDPGCMGGCWYKTVV